MDAQDFGRWERRRARERAEQRRDKWRADAEARELLEALRDPNSEGPRF